MLNQGGREEGVDRVFQALADPTRRLLVNRLARGPASVSELARPFAMSLPAVVQHLQVLEACGLVRSEKVGRVRTCRLEPTALSGAESWLGGLRAAWEGRMDRLAGLIAAQQRQEGPATSPPHGTEDAGRRGAAEDRRQRRTRRTRT